MREIRTLRLTWRGLETDNKHCTAPVLDPTLGELAPATEPAYPVAV